MATPIYTYSDGTIITFRTQGPFKFPTITYGTSLDSNIVKGQSLEGQKTSNNNYGLLAEELINSYNNFRIFYNLPEATLVNVTNSSPTPPPEEIKKIPYSIKGTIVDSQSLNPIVGATVTSTPNISVTTNGTGDFVISGEIESNATMSLDIKAANFQSTSVSPYKGDNTIKDDVGVIQLQSTQQSLTEDKIKSSQLNRNQIKEISKGKKDLSYYAEEKLANQVNTLKTTLIPAILTMVAAFGVTQASKIVSEKAPNLTPDQASKITPDKLKKALDSSFCPAPAELTNLINRKNKLVKQLNNSLKIIDTTTKTLGITGGIIQALEIALKLQVAIPYPLPPAVGEISKVLEKRISQLKLVNAGILSILIILRQVLLQAIQLLNLLDKLVQKCYPDADQEKVSLELTALTTQQSTQLSPVVTNVNGFEMGVETENSPNTLKRRRAIARNKQNVVMLKGEWSFSSIDQILIDELVFYIQQNNLKAD
jgi:hypothetical protein